MFPRFIRYCRSTSCGIVKRLLIAYFIVTFLPKNIKIRSCVLKLKQAKGGMFFRHGVILGLNFWLMTMWLSFQPLYQSCYLFASPVSGGLANSMHSALGTNLIAGSPPPTEWFNRVIQFVLSNRENLLKKIIAMIKNHTLAKFSIQCQYLKLEIVRIAAAKPAR